MGAGGRPAALPTSLTHGKDPRRGRGPYLRAPPTEALFMGECLDLILIHVEEKAGAVLVSFAAITSYHRLK